jgi:hypothetical protein
MRTTEQLPPLHLADSLTLARALVAMDEAIRVLTEKLGLDADTDPDLLGARSSRAALAIIYAQETPVMRQRLISRVLYNEMDGWRATGAKHG